MRSRVLALLIVLCAAVPLYAFRHYATAPSGLSRHVLKKDPARVSEGYNVWYYTATGSPEPNVDTVMNAFSRALTAWNNVPGSLWRFRTTPVGMTATSHSPSDSRHDLYWYNESGTTLAVTPWYWNGSGYVGDGWDIRFNSSHRWNFTGFPWTSVDFTMVATHELGHVLGGAHTADPDSVMYASMPYYAIKTLQPDDTYVMRHLYGAKLSAGVNSAPASMTVGEKRTLRFYLYLDGYTIAPSTTSSFLDVSNESSNASIRAVGNSGWNAIGTYSPGQTIYRYNTQTMSAVYPLISAEKTNAPAGATHYVDVEVTANGPGTIVLKYRACYLDLTYQENLDFTGTTLPYRGFGDSVPRLTSGTTAQLDQQGFPAYVVRITVASPKPTVSITSPCSSSCTSNTPAITIGGTAGSSGNPALSHVTVYNPSTGSGGSDQGPSGTSSSFSIPNIALATGTNTIFATAYDTAGNASDSDSITVNYQPQSQAPPTAQTSAASNVGQYSSRLNGSVNPNGASTSTSFRYWRSGQGESTAQAQTLTGSTSQNVSADIANLACDTQYSFYVRATNSGGTSDGSTLSFRTQSCPQQSSCSYTISPSSAPGDGNGGNGAVQVTGSPSNCTGNWAASSTASWLSLTSTASGSGPGSWQVPYSYTANPSSTSNRSGSIQFTGSFPSGGTFTLTQSPAQNNNLPNLTPYLPPGWSDRIVVSNSTGTTVNTAIRSTDTPYVDWAMVNSGGAATTARFWIDLYVDGQWVAAWYLDPPFDGWAAVYDHIVGTLSPGTHTIGIVIDIDQFVAESNESDNQFTRTLVVSEGSSTRGDFDRDGKADVLWRANASGANALWLMNGMTKAVGAYLETASSIWSVEVTGDFDGDGATDVLWRDPVSGANAMWLMNGTTKSLGAYLESAPPNWSIAGVGDFNGDGRDDVLWRDRNTGANAMWLMNGTTKTSGIYMESVTTAWDVAGVGDFNADGKADIFWRAAASGANVMWLMNGGTKTFAATLENAAAIWRVAGVADFNGDGRADVLWRDPASGSNAMWLMNGTTKSAGLYMDSVPAVYTIAKVGDFNGDGMADIFWRIDNTGANAVWLMNGATRTNSTALEAAGTQWRVIP